MLDSARGDRRLKLCPSDISTNQMIRFQPPIRPDSGSVWEYGYTHSRTDYPCNEGLSWAFTGANNNVKIKTKASKIFTIKR